MSSTLFRTIGKPAVTALACAIAGLLAACAPLPPAKPKVAGPIVFPAPPDEPRFVYERTIYGSADVVPQEAQSQLRQLVTGEGQKGEGLNKPNTIAPKTASADRYSALLRKPSMGRRFFGQTWGVHSAVIGSCLCCRGKISMHAET